MSADANGYYPNNFKIKSGVPVRWEITDRGVSGCTNAIVSKTLLSQPLRLKPLSVTTLTFDPPKTPGIYRFTCWMGMISGTIEVIN
jgi:plastocyanin domain-containing protein